MSETVQSNLFQFSEELPWEEAAPGIQRQVYGYNQQLMMVKVKFEKEAVGAVHEHLHAQVSYVQSGEFELTIGAETKVLRTGDGYFVPPHTRHGAVCLEAGVLIDVFSPYREDFLQAQLP